MHCLVVSSALFFIPATIAFIKRKVFRACAIFMLSALSITNHSHVFGVWANWLDTVYVRTIVTCFTYHGLIISTPLTYLGCMCTLMAAYCYWKRRKTTYHVYMHMIGTIGFIFYVYAI